MIFGHAPRIFPALLARPLAFRRAFYVHLGLLPGCSSCAWWHTGGLTLTPDF